MFIEPKIDLFERIVSRDKFAGIKKKFSECKEPLFADKFFQYFKRIRI